MKVIKRDCTEVDFDKSKISTAILKAMKNGSGIVKPKIAEDIANEIYEECKDKDEILEKLNKGFKITNVQEYNIDELLSYKKYKDNWKKLKEYINEANKDLYWTNNYDDILCVMQELEQGSDNNVKD